MYALNDFTIQRCTIDNHDLVLIFGDLNYRICLHNEVVRPAIAAGNFDQLKEQDELIQSFQTFSSSLDQHNKLFRDFTEGVIHFPPTYKYDKDSQNFDTSKKQRVPSWCDRILYKNHGRITLREMDSVQDVTFSDHRPVYATFELVTHRISREKAKMMEDRYFQSLKTPPQNAPRHLQALQMKYTSEMHKESSCAEEDDDGFSQQILIHNQASDTLNPMISVDFSPQHEEAKESLIE